MPSKPTYTKPQETEAQTRARIAALEAAPQTPERDVLLAVYRKRLTPPAPRVVAEPKYLRNTCPTCNEPMLGSHYHEVPAIVAECWTCCRANHTHERCSYVLPEDDDQCTPQRFLSRGLADDHRALGHDVREVTR